MKCLSGRIILCALFAALIHCAATASARDLPTTYGEDPVPAPYRNLSPPYTAYGLDPVPVVSPLERWLSFKIERRQRLAERGIEVEPRQRPSFLERIHWPWYSKR